MLTARQFGLILLIVVACTPKDSGGGDSEFAEYYANGSPKAIGKIDAAGRRVGHWVYYYENSEPRASGAYNKGMKEGVWTYTRPLREINWLTYHDKELNFELNVPDSYQVTPNYRGTGVVAAFSHEIQNGFKQNFNVTRINDLGGSSLSEMVSKADPTSVPKLTFVEIDVHEAAHTTLIVEFEGIEVFNRRFFIKAGQSLYMLNFFDTEENDNIFYEVAFSFRHPIKNAF